MRVLQSRRGAGLIDVIATICLVGATGLVLATTFPSSFSCSRQARDNKIATCIAQEKVEQLRALGYESLTEPILVAAGIIDQDPTSSPYSFTTTNDLPDQLQSGSGSLELTDVSSDTREAVVTVRWVGKSGQDRSVVLTTLFVDKRPRQGT